MSCYKLDGHKVIPFDSLEDLTEKDLETQTIFYTKLVFCKNIVKVSTIFNPLGYNLDPDHPMVFDTIIYTDNKELKDNLNLFNARNSSILKAIDAHHDAISFASGIILGNNIKNDGDHKND